MYVLYRYIIFTLCRALEKVYFIRIFQFLEVNENEYVLMLPKVGTRSLRDLSIWDARGTSGPLVMSNWQKNYLASKNYRFVFSFRLNKFVKSRSVTIIERPWVDRVKSCYRQKFGYPSGLFYFWQYYPYLYPRMPESLFLHRVFSMPEIFREKHFAKFPELERLQGCKRLKIEDLDKFLEEQFGQSLRSNVS